MIIKELMGPKKSVLGDLTEEDAKNGYVSTPMYDESWGETPLDRRSVRDRNYRKEREDGR
jgi:hypothetical protein